MIVVGFRIIVALIGLAPALAGAEIYRCADATGKVTYSLTPPATPCHARASVAKAAPGGTSPADFPRVDSATQQRRDMARRDILEAELSAELQALDVASVDAAPRHQRNIAELKKELSYMR